MHVPHGSNCRRQQASEFARGPDATSQVPSGFARRRGAKYPMHAAFAGTGAAHCDFRGPELFD